MQAVAVLERLDQRLRDSGAADIHRADRREVELAGVRVEVLQHAHPDRRHAAGQRDALGVEQIDQARGIEVRPRHHQLGADHHRRERHPPGVGVEHRHHRQDDVVLADAHAVIEREAEGVQHERAVRVEDALRVAGRAGRVAHRGGGALVGVGEILRRLGPGDQRLVFERSRRPPAWSRRRRSSTGTLTRRAHLFPQRQQALVDEDGAVLRVVDDVGELVGVEAQVERVQHAAHQRDAEVGLEVRTVVPAERGDAVAGLDAEIEQRAGEAARADRRSRRRCSGGSDLSAVRQTISWRG